MEPETKPCAAYGPTSHDGRPPAPIVNFSSRHSVPAAMFTMSEAA